MAKDKFQQQVFQEIAALKELIFTRIEAMEKLFEDRFKSSLLAIEKAEEAQKLRNEQQNEWRGQSKDREAMFATRNEVERSNVDIKDMQIKMANSEGKASQNSVLLAYALSGVSIVIALGGLIVKFIK